MYIDDPLRDTGVLGKVSSYCLGPYCNRGTNPLGSHVFSKGEENKESRRM